MVVKIKKGDSSSVIQEKINEITSASGTPKGFDAKKYSGIIKSDVDPVAYQRKLRDEWN